MGDDDPLGPHRVGLQGRAWDVWFAPKRWESERRYARLGVRVLKKYVPTGGELVGRWLYRRFGWRLLDAGGGGAALRRYEKMTRDFEAIHLTAFLGFTAQLTYRCATGQSNAVRCGLTLAFYLLVLIYPITLQRYNRLRLYAALRALQRQRHH